VKLTRKLAVSAAFLGIAAYCGAAGAGTQDGKNALDAKQYDKAFKELLPEAAKGDPDAQYILARMHQAGWGTPKDMKKAQEYFSQAARLGHVPSQKEYGAALALGDGVEQDVNEGLKWLYIAAQNGSSAAAEYAARFSKSFPRAVVSEARRAAHRWNREHKAAN
jgi:uncharacterized protein